MEPENAVAVLERGCGVALSGGPALLPDEPRHLGGDNYGFADGHAQWIERKQLPDGTWAKEPADEWVIWEPVVEESKAEEESPPDP